MHSLSNNLFIVMFIIFQPFDWIRNSVHFPMNEIQKLRQLFFIKQNGSSFGFGRLGAHKELKQGPSLFQTSLLYIIKILS